MSEHIGVTTYYDGSSKYDGGWDTFSRSGQGTFTFVTGGVYEGNWDRGCIQSHADPCKCTFKNGDTYEGEWANGKMCGRGTYSYVNGDMYTGGWKNSKREGSAAYKHSNGWVYLGPWKDGVKHGEGFFTEGEEGAGFIEEWKIGTRLIRKAATVEEILARKEEIKEEEAAKRAEEERLAREAKIKEQGEIRAKLEEMEEGEEKEALVARLAVLDEELAPKEDPPPEE